MPKSRPFKKLFCDRPDLLKLPGSALKVWLCHFMHEGQDRKSWPSLETICEETDLEQRVVKKVRQQMLNGGWLEKSGDRSVKGQFKVPIITATRGVVPLPDYKSRVTKSHHGRSDKKSLRTRLQKVTMAEGQKVTMDPVTKSHLEVDPEKQVYPRRSISKDQVEGAHLSTANAFCVRESKNAEAGSLAKIQEPELQKVTMVRSEPSPVLESRLVRSPEPSPVAPVQMAPPEPDEFEGMESAQIISLIPRDRGMQLYNRTKGHYSREAAIAEVLKYREETKELTAQ